MKLKNHTALKAKAELLLESILGPGFDQNTEAGINQIKEYILTKDFDENEVNKLSKSDVPEYKGMLFKLVQNEVESNNVLKMYENTLDKNLEFDFQTRSEIFLKSMLLKAYIELFLKEDIKFNDIVKLIKVKVYGS
jgi:hypothetical protein